MVQFMTADHKPDVTIHKAPKVRLAVLQRVCPPYRVPLFRELTNALEDDFCLFIGDDLPESKVRNAGDLNGVNHLKLKTKFLRLGARVLPYHFKLTKALKTFNPDVVLCEGESHFLGYLQAIFYRYLYKRKVGLIHWCFISLPGEPLGGRGLRAKIKTVFRRFFDAFLVYSSFSRDVLRALGEPDEKIFVATNVTDVQQSLRAAESLTVSQEQARKILGLPHQFTVLYLGTLDEVKKPELLLDVAAMPTTAAWNFVFAGAGRLLEPMKSRVSQLGMSNVYFVGRIKEELPLYFRASDVLVVPGRGGIVFSEAMAFQLPVIVHQADGTEFDLVQHDVSGLRVREAKAECFEEALRLLSCDAELCARMGSAGKQFVESIYTIPSMIQQILRASAYAARRKLAER